MLGPVTSKAIELTKLALVNLAPATSGRRYEVADSAVKGLQVRVTDVSLGEGRFRGKAAHITFVMLGRFPPSLGPVDI
jgi:hypothetical protein